MQLARRPGPSVRRRVSKHSDGVRRQREDRVATEEPLEIRLSWPGHRASRMVVLMRTPGSDFELAAGLLLSEQVIGHTSDIRTVAYCTDESLSPEQEFNVVTVSLDRAPRSLPAQRYGGPAAAISACGVCGKQSIDDVIGTASGINLRAAWEGTQVSAEVLLGLPDRLRESQRIFSQTGGIHGAGLFTEDGAVVVVREDIGRHNAVDKVVGARLLAGASTALPLLCVSGRIGFELVQKAVTAGVGTIAAVGAPSSLAVDLAESAGLCTVGFLRGRRFVVYSCPERVGV